MKEQVQENGVRKWYGDDLTNMQSEINRSIIAIVEEYGSCIISGVNVTESGGVYSISDGVAFLKDSTGSNGKMCRVYAQTGLTAGNFPLYMVQATKDRTQVPAYGRAYKDGNTKNIIVEYYAKLETVQPAHSNYVTITSNNQLRRLRDAMQSALYRFVTDSEKTAWNGKLNSSSYTASDVLDKIKTVDGTGSGLDADLLDGKEASEFVLGTSYTDAAVLNKIKNVDGTNSGLDADLLDGKHASEFQLTADMVSTNTANKGVKRDSNGDFMARNITVSDIIIL